MATEPRPMDPERLRHLRRFIEQQAENPHNSIARQLAELLADRDHQAQRAEEWERKAVGLGADALAETVRLKDEIGRLRSRVRVEADDVERAGVTWAHFVAWATANSIPVPGGWADGSDGEVLTEIIRTAAFLAQRPGLDILDEMAAITIEPAG